MYTRHQTARGARPDADVNGKFYLIKKVSEMRLTYQIRVLTYAAKTTGRKLVIQLPPEAKVHTTLRDFVREHADIVKIERA